MAAQARGWTDEERRRLETLRERLEQLSAKLRARLPARILLIKAADVLDGAPHTRVNAIVLPQQFVATARREALAYVLAHELFHLLSRHDDQARERLYAAIGFHPCERVELPHSLERERITNPDAPQDRHTIRARYRGQPVEAMPVRRPGLELGLGLAGLALTTALVIAVFQGAAWLRWPARLVNYALPLGVFWLCGYSVRALGLSAGPRRGWLALGLIVVINIVAGIILSQLLPPGELPTPPGADLAEGIDRLLRRGPELVQNAVLVRVRGAGVDPRPRGQEDGDPQAGRQRSQREFLG